MGAIKRLLLLSLVFAPCIGWRAAVPGAGGAHRLRARPPALCDADPLDQADPLDEEAMVTRELNKELTAKFNEELYRHLKQRPEYENSDMYRQLDQRVDVDEKFRYGTPSDADAALLTNCQLPKPSQTPGEVIDIVLRALSSKDWERPEQGIELLRNYSSQASALAPTEEITPLMLYDYFRESRYSILLDFASVIYTKKLELSLDRKHAMQQLKLVSLDGAPVPVTFRLSNNGEVWLIDQVLVKSATNM